MEGTTGNTSPYLTLPARLISWILHPLFIPTYIFLLLVYRFPYEFMGITTHDLYIRMFSVFWTTCFFPAFSVFLLWRLQLSKNIFLRTQQERIIPYVITMFFYWWMYYLSRNFTDQPAVLKFFYFGIFISTSLGLIMNNFMKVSLHGIAMGGAMTAVVLFSVFYHAPLGMEIIAAVLLTGLVCTSRLLISDHTEAEVYGGVIAGAVCQLIAYWFVF